MGSIVVTSGRQKGEYLPFGQRTSVIGRDEVLSLQVLDALVSRKHLRICFDKAANKYFAEDMHSKHGVSINGHKITDSMALTDGHEILIGNTTLLYTDEYLDSRDSALYHYKKRRERVYRTRGNSYIFPTWNGKKQWEVHLSERTRTMAKKKVANGLWSKSEVALLKKPFPE
jgi:pSer/pThr/pTyr-binding forkhead associated (FHA) protein